MIYVIILLIVGVIIFFFLRDRDKMLAQQVDANGGMKQKYALLIEWLTSEPNAQIVKIKRDHIQISMKMQTTETLFYITETFNGVEVEWNAKFGMMGNHEKKWKFSLNTTNEEMIEKIGTDIDEYSRKIM